MVCEMDTSKIIVKELTNPAWIHRETLYLHYTSIEALYEEVLQELVNNYYREIDKISLDAPFTEVIYVFLNIWRCGSPIWKNHMYRKLL